MTLSTTSMRISYAGNDVTTAFAFPYLFLANIDLRVYIRSSTGDETLQTLGREYAVAGAGSSAGGTVTMGTAPATGERLVIFRDPPIIQTTDYAEGSTFNADSVERAFDKHAMVEQRVSDRIGHALKIHDTDVLASGNYDTGGQRITDLADATANGDAVTLAQLNARHFLPGPVGPAGNPLLTEDQLLSGGVNVTSKSLSTGNITIDCGKRPLQFITNGGAFTITAPALDGSCVLLVTNNASAGVITFSGFTVGTYTGAVPDLANGNKFSIFIWQDNGVSGYFVYPHQPFVPPFELEVALWAAAVAGAGGTLTDARKTLVNNLVLSLKTHGIWTKLDRLWLFASADEATAKIDVVARQTVIKHGGGPVFLADRGYTGDGLDDYIDTGFKPSTAGGVFTRNSAHCSGYDRTAGTGGSTPMHYSAFDGATNYINHWNFNGAAQFQLNNTPNPLVGAAASATSGFWLNVRTTANQRDVYKNGSSFLTDAANPSSALPTEFIMLFAFNNAGALSLFSDHQMAAFTIGAGLTSTEAGNFSTDINTYMTAVGANVY